MTKILAVLTLMLGCATVAQADVWKWVDASGNTHFVDTNKPIFTWVDDRGDSHFSDTPDHEDAITVQLVWVSAGSLSELQDSEDESGSGYVGATETDGERAEREAAESYYCQRATEIYESYVNAPRLYKTSDSGERVYLDKDEAEQTIAETREQKDKVCS